MYVSDSTTGCCAIKAIHNLKREKCADTAFKNFCVSQLGHISKFETAPPKLAAFYMFSSGPSVLEDKPGGSVHSSRTWPNYGEEFAKFIKQNRFGRVATVGKQYNFQYHPNTKAQVWLWKPAYKRVLAWWLKNSGGAI